LKFVLSCLRRGAVEGGITVAIAYGQDDCSSARIVGSLQSNSGEVQIVPHPISWTVFLIIVMQQPQGQAASDERVRDIEMDSLPGWPELRLF
jgi:hypothetical protein